METFSVHPNDMWKDFRYELTALGRYFLFIQHRKVERLPVAWSAKVEKFPVEREGEGRIMSYLCCCDETR
ncbi:hypothetical protein D3C76_1444740 [compost metagenome]